MRTISTRQIETSDEQSHVYALRYDYYVVDRELDVDSERRHRLLRDLKDDTAMDFATFAGDDIVGCFRAKLGSPETVPFGADWAFADFLHDIPDTVALISGLCTVPHLRERERIIAHMVRESVAIAKDFELPHVFFEMCPELWPDFHAAGLRRKGGARIDQRTGVLTAVFQLEHRARVRFPVSQSSWLGSETIETVSDDHVRPKLAIVAGGRA